MSCSQNTTILFVLLAAIATGIFIPVSADTGVSNPLLPESFYGVIYIGESPASAGYSVEATGVGVAGGVQGNPVTSRTGSYGSSSLSDETRLVVQGNIAPGTPLSFFVGGYPADVSGPGTNGLWQQSYPFSPGENTELHLRIASLPAAGQTREPTPVLTVSGSVADASGSSSLPQVPGSVVQPQVSGNPGTSPAGNGAGASQPGPGQETGSAPGNTAGGDAGSTGLPSLPGSGSPTLIIAGFLVIVLVILAGAFSYRSRQKKSDDEKKEE
ncbi:MAG TPA: hypothetical protein HA256_03840 [Methanoregulaceae archaeon]|nr:hypothetical protein [Methanoregulaceae archaeon]